MLQFLNFIPFYIGYGSKNKRFLRILHKFFLNFFADQSTASCACDDEPQMRRGRRSFEFPYDAKTFDEAMQKRNEVPYIDSHCHIDTMFQYEGKKWKLSDWPSYKVRPILSERLLDSTVLTHRLGGFELWDPFPPPPIP